MNFLIKVLICLIIIIITLNFIIYKIKETVSNILFTELALYFANILHEKNDFVEYLKIYS